MCFQAKVFLIGILAMTSLGLAKGEASKLLLGVETPFLMNCHLYALGNCGFIWDAGSLNFIYGLAAIGNTVFAATYGKSIWKCNLDEFSNHKCSKFHTADRSINDVAIYGEYIYAGLYGGSILRCLIHKNDSCVKINETDVSIYAIQVTADYIHAGLSSGIIWRCLKENNTCITFNQLNGGVTALDVANNKIYAGTGAGSMYSCSLDQANSCEIINQAQDVAIDDIKVHRNKIYAVLGSGQLWRCSLTEKHSCDTISVAVSSRINSIVITYYTSSLSWDCRYENYYCSLSDLNIFSLCVPYYDFKERAAYELHVQDGKLYKYDNILFDTSDADFAFSGKKAIFVMDPAGHLYASNSQANGIQQSSFIAGGHAAGVGEMEVKQGVITHLTTCSKHYAVTETMKRQVIDELKLKGYLDAENIVIQECLNHTLTCTNNL